MGQAHKIAILEVRKYNQVHLHTQDDLMTDASSAEESTDIVQTHNSNVR